MNCRLNKKKAGWIAAFTVLAAILLAPFSGYLLLPGTAHAQSQSGFSEGNNPRANFWRAVREGNSGYSAVKGDETNVLIQNGGENWRQLRKPIAKYGSWAMGISALACLLFFLIRGRLKLDNGRSGLTVARWTVLDRTLHWTNAILFIILTITGLSLLYGRSLLIPVIGKDAFAAYANLTKSIHDYLGPVFAVILTLVLLKWIWMNFPTGTDIKWLLKGGGVFGKTHVSAGKTNGGEKIWFWLVFVAGIALIVSGIVLDFPNLGADRGDMQLANLVHSSAALILIAAAICHIYIGTIGSEGSLEAMTTGRVDVEWAKQHHDLWYEELIKNGEEPKTPAQIKAEQDSPHAGGTHSAA